MNYINGKEEREDEFQVPVIKCSPNEGSWMFEGRIVDRETYSEIPIKIECGSKEELVRLLQIAHFLPDIPS